jgi:hypothetical protein
MNNVALGEGPGVREGSSNIVKTSHFLMEKALTLTLSQSNIIHQLAQVRGA